MSALVPKRDILLDADVLVYVFAHRNQTNVEFQLDGDGPTVVTSVANADKAVSELRDFVANLHAALQGADIYMALSDANANFRKDIFPAYKSNRAAKGRPALYQHLRESIMETREWHPKISPGLEGDDVLGIWLSMTDVPVAICCSIDKDMHTIPGLHYNWDRPGEGIVEVSPDAAERTFLTQTLTGDTVDGYPGAKGVGPVTATRILDAVEPWDYATAWTRVVAAFHKAGHTTYDAVTQARMARILTRANGAVELWEPPSERSE